MTFPQFDGFYKNLVYSHVAISLGYFPSHQIFLSSCLGMMFLMFVSD